jgi:MHS family citrate/tricarballylate:H+ symporter-like MFS transporter
MVVALTEVIPASVRTSGFSLAYSLATTLGGSSLAVSTWLIKHTGDKAAPGFWMSFAGLCGLAATLALYRRPAHGRQYAAPRPLDI